MRMRTLCTRRFPLLTQFYVLTKQYLGANLEFNYFYSIGGHNDNTKDGILGTITFQIDIILLGKTRNTNNEVLDNELQKGLCFNPFGNYV